LTSEPELSGQQAVEAIAAIAMLQGLNSAAALQQFLSARQQWAQQLLESAVVANEQVQQQPGRLLAQLVQQVQACIAQVRWVKALVCMHCAFCWQPALAVVVFKRTTLVIMRSTVVIFQASSLSLNCSAPQLSCYLRRWSCCGYLLLLSCLGNTLPLVEVAAWDVLSGLTGRGAVHEHTTIWSSSNSIGRRSQQPAPGHELAAVEPAGR
jgi:hypothetical protein